MSTFSEDTGDGWTPGLEEACGDTMYGGHRVNKQVCVSPHASVYQSVTWTVWTSSLSTDVSLDIKTGSHCVIRWRSGVLPPPSPITAPQCPVPNIQVSQGHTRAQASLGASASAPRHITRLGEYGSGWGAPGPPRAALFTCGRLPVSDATARLWLHKGGSWSSSGSSWGVAGRVSLS